MNVVQNVITQDVCLLIGSIDARVARLRMWANDVIKKLATVYTDTNAAITAYAATVAYTCN